MVTATREAERIETKPASLEELGGLMGLPIKVLPWWGSRRQGSRSGLGGVKRWLCPVIAGEPKKRPEIRNGVIYLWEGACHYPSHYHGAHTHRQEIEVKDARHEAILIAIQSYGVVSHHLLGMDNNAPYTIQVIKRIQSLDEAFQWLLPKRVKESVIQGLDVKRQGDWFFIPHGREPNLNEWDDFLHYGLYKRNHLYRNLPLVYNGALTRHRATLVVYNSVLGLPCEVPIVKGKVRCPDHETLYLPEWHIAIRNRSHPWRNIQQGKRLDD